MHGRTFPHPLAWGLVGLVILAAACGQPSSPQSLDSPPAPPTAALDSSAAGTVTGHVRWDGPLPKVAPMPVRSGILPVDVLKQQRQRPNPNAPVIDPHTRGVAGAVVFLRGAGVHAAPPWPHAHVRVELRNLEMHVLQDGVDSHVGLVRLGDAIEAVSRDHVFHSLHLGGADFFTIPLPDPDDLVTRPLDRPGLIELTSAAGYPWMRAYLFVAEHPYYTRTDAAGRFVLEQVPAGRYEVVCWMPSWIEQRHDREPETGIVSRVFFRPPLEKGKGVAVGKRQTTPVEFILDRDSFRSPSQKRVGGHSSVKRR
jgi:hypothetical protein